MTEYRAEWRITEAADAALEQAAHNRGSGASDCPECPDFRADSVRHLAEHEADVHDQHERLRQLEEREDEEPRG